MSPIYIYIFQIVFVAFFLKNNEIPKNFIIDRFTNMENNIVQLIELPFSFPITFWSNKIFPKKQFGVISMLLNFFRHFVFLQMYVIIAKIIQ